MVEYIQILLLGRILAIFTRMAEPGPSYQYARPGHQFLGGGGGGVKHIQLVEFPVKVDLVVLCCVTLFQEINYVKFRVTTNGWC